MKHTTEKRPLTAEQICEIIQKQQQKVREYLNNSVLQAIVKTQNRFRKGELTEQDVNIVMAEVIRDLNSGALTL